MKAQRGWYTGGAGGDGADRRAVPRQDGSAVGRLVQQVQGEALRSIPIVEPEAEHVVGLITPRRDLQTPVLAALIEEAARFGARAR